ncbi:putative glycosyl hydrolase [Xylariomycetidae sp. FL0641]|nr:putative glycosyl hydrolase [Xylariomycetidae sp. FL0641]
MHFTERGRSLLLRGVNLADGKFPRDQPSYKLESLSSEVGSTCTYLDTPLKLDEAPHHLKRLRYYGFNVLRVPVVWEALEHEGPGIYDDEYIDHIVKLVRLCNEHGFKVIINPHQDIWSRYSGGSGAPLWTLHACGLDPDYFAETHAAVRYAEWPLDRPEKDPRASPNMMWTTNHNRLASATLFTLFFAGRDFAPRCRLDGANIQDYLQGRYLAAYARLAAALGDLPFAYDSMNEPEPGYIGWRDLRANERDDTAKIGSTPTPVQAMRLGMGRAQTVDEYRLGQTGPHKTGTLAIAPSRACWLQAEDPRWEWTREESWPLGTCVWALHGVWDAASGDLQAPGYFDRMPRSSAAACAADNDGADPLSFMASYWQEFHARWTATVRAHAAHAILLVQPSVFTPPPATDDDDDEPQRRMAYAPHFYDGLTMMQRRWHARWNADVLGILRGRYRVRARGLRVGKGSVRRVLAAQLGALAADVAPRPLPVLVGETGIPFDLEGGRAYRNGDYTDHVAALDALLAGCDAHRLSCTLWAYSALNCHEWGDRWNGEDLSIVCAETASFPRHEMLRGARAPAAWCRPFVREATGDLVAMAFDLATSRFELEIRSDGPGWAEVYVPWLHYRREDDAEDLALEVVLSSGSWARDGQLLRWEYEGGGTLRVQREGGVLSPERLGTIVA